MLTLSWKVDECKSLVIGRDAEDLAKAVTSLGGRRAFVVSGGFEAWRAEVKRCRRYRCNPC